MYRKDIAKARILESFFEMKYDIIKLIEKQTSMALESFFEMKYDII